MQYKKQEDSKEIKIPIIINILLWLSYLAWPTFFLASYISLSANIIAWMFWIFISFSIILSIYAVIKKTLRIYLAFPLVFNFLMFIILLVGFIILETSNTGTVAKDARIKSAIEQFKLSAENYKTEKGNYGVALSFSSCMAIDSSLVASGSDGLALCNDIQSQGKGDLILNVNFSGTAYCIQKTLPGGSIWCLDSAGIVGCVGEINCNYGMKGCDIIDYSCL
jgi:hypothetical protein